MGLRINFVLFVIWLDGMGGGCVYVCLCVRACVRACVHGGREVAGEDRGVGVAMCLC